MNEPNDWRKYVPQAGLVRVPASAETAKVGGAAYFKEPFSVTVGTKARHFFTGRPYRIYGVSDGCVSLRPGASAVELSIPFPFVEVTPPVPPHVDWVLPDENKS
jgi:hypothetical protein